MDLQDKYDELDNIITTLDSLIDEITDRDYIDQLREIKWQAENELEEVSKDLREEYDREERQMNYDYERSVG
jgi:ElaB/YqjD/DUF883 family membrane-anchored ribosome-binding protein